MSDAVPFGVPGDRKLRGWETISCPGFRQKTADQGFSESIKNIDKDGRPRWEFRSVNGESRFS